MAIVTLVVLLGAGCSQPVGAAQNPRATDEPLQVSGEAHGASELRVMTRNVYVGTDVDRVLAAGSPDEIPGLVAEAFQLLTATNFPERAQSLAREIGWRRPHLIGLQEVSTIRTQRPGDAVAGGTSSAETVVYDFLALLLDALASRGLHYVVAARRENTDVELPMIVALDPPSFDDVRLTDADVILARADVIVTGARAEAFRAQRIAPLGNDRQIEIPRGFTAIEATVDGRTYRFVNTHLEPAPTEDLLAIQFAQAEELIGTFGADSLPVVLVGDLNSPAPAGPTYVLLTRAGFADAWNHQPSPLDGFTCCHALDLTNPTAEFDERIDFILVRHPTHPHDPFSRPVTATVIGDEAFNRTASGRWPSDHGGVVARMDIRREPREWR